MNKELKKIKTAMDNEDFDKARQLSDAYVEGHPEEFTDFADMTIDTVVHAVETFREAGMLDNQYRAEAWHFHRWEPQNIGGAVFPALRNAN